CGIPPTTSVVTETCRKNSHRNGFPGLGQRWSSGCCGIPPPEKRKKPQSASCKPNCGKCSSSDLQIAGFLSRDISTPPHIGREGGSRGRLPLSLLAPSLDIAIYYARKLWQKERHYAAAQA